MFVEMKSTTLYVTLHVHTCSCAESVCIGCIFAALDCALVDEVTTCSGNVCCKHYGTLC